MTRITLVHQAALGDTVLLLPLIRALRLRFAADSPHITLVTHPNLGQMLTMLGLVDAYASADDREHSLWFTEPPGGVPNSNPAWSDCDLLLSAVSSGADAWALNARLAQETRPSAPSRAASRLYFSPRPPNDFPGHVTQWHRQQLAALDLPEPPPPLARVNPDGVLLIHPGSGGDAKCWPRDEFLELGRDLKRNGILPTFILGEAEQERWGRDLLRTLQDEFPWYLHMGLYELAEKISRARLMLGNDSGVTHLAAALGIPVIALFGPSNDVQWRPIGPAVHILRAPPPDESDLNALSRQTVLAAILQDLRRLPAL